MLFPDEHVRRHKKTDGGVAGSAPAAAALLDRWLPRRAPRAVDDLTSPRRATRTTHGEGPEHSAQQVA